MTLARLRLASGLVLFAFVVGHLLNHTLGLVSLEAMDRATALSLGPWRTLPGTLLLAGAACVHVAVALVSLYRRRTLRLRRWEAAQIALGVTIPVLLAQHVAGTRIAHEVLGLETDYPYVQLQLWVLRPDAAILQALVLVVVWAHACIGLHFWLRLRPWYRQAASLLYAVALLLPALSLAGFLASGMAVRALAARQGWTEQILTAARATPEASAFVGQATVGSVAGFALLVLGVFAARGLRGFMRARSGLPRLYYRDNAVLDILPGSTVLETIRAAGIPHASVCGGRGRCSTCRVRVGLGAEHLPPPSAREDKVLRRIGAPPSVRLACQIRPTRDVEVTPLLPPTATVRDAFAGSAYLQGEEREIAILFADLRDFTQLAHGKLPFDVVFVLNRYFAAMGGAIEQAGGRVDKFIGDGVMALFGVEDGPEEGSRRALDAARRMAAALDELNEALSAELPDPLSIGIGIHVGPVIVGAMGYGPARALTAIGDAVNTASRLEELTKQFNVQLVASDEVMRRAGIDPSRFDPHEADLRGRDQLLPIRLVPSALELSDGRTKSAAQPSPPVGEGGRGATG
jgi:adenylate cyclase